jgi:hypothetical protein
MSANVNPKLTSIDELIKNQYGDIGSTKRDGESQVVQDDFQLICWDFVAEPSTPGAFMMSEGKKISENELRKTFTKGDRIDRIFNEVLGWRKN